MQPGIGRKDVPAHKKGRSVSPLYISIILFAPATASNTRSVCLMIRILPMREWVLTEVKWLSWQKTHTKKQ